MAEIVPTGVGAIAALGEIVGGLVSFGASLIFGFLGSLFSGLFGGNDVNALNQAVNQLRSQLAQAVDTLTRFAWTIATGLAAILKFLYNLLTELLNQIWKLLKQLAQQLEKIVKNVLPKLLQAIKNARAFMNWVYKTFIRPILNYLQYIRRFLFILRLFHVKFAGKLDAWIVQIEGKIIGPFLYVLRTINGIGTWINLIVTAGGVIQRAVFINTMYAYQSDWVNMFYAGQTAGVFGPAAPTQLTPAATPTYAQTRGDLQVYVQTGGGPVALDAQTAQGALQSVLAS